MRYFTFFYKGYADNLSSISGSAGLKRNGMPSQSSVHADILDAWKESKPDEGARSVVITGWKEMTKEDFEAFHEG